jgi:hypothetical protein
MTKQAFPPITISFEWEDDGHTLKTIIDDGETQEPWWLSSGLVMSQVYPELLAVYRRKAVLGAVRNWADRSGK